MELTGKVAVVTGGAVRIGRAIVEALVDSGVRVCLHYGSSCAEAERAALAFNEQGGHVVTVQADLQNPFVAAQTIIGSAFEEFGQVDFLVNSAAIFEPGDVRSTTEGAWDRHFDINLKSPFFLCQAFASQLVPGQRAHIVNIADWRAIRPGRGYLAYTLTKSSLVAMTQVLAQELSPDVQVNALALGAILPPPGMLPGYFEELVQRIPLRRTGSADDVKDALLFLLRSDFITGDVLRITGGEELS